MGILTAILAGAILYRGGKFISERFHKKKQKPIRIKNNRGW